MQSESQYGTCIVMETKTGKIKAIANLGRNKNGKYDENLEFCLADNRARFNHKISYSLICVGSRFSSKINDLVEVGSTGNAYVAVRNVNDAERAPNRLTVRECFAHSSNVGMSKAGQ